MPPKPTYAIRSGIYTITNTVNGHQYIGSAKDLKGRQRNHFYELAKGQHRNDHLQKAYNLYGIDSFQFNVLEFVPILTDLVSREQHYIDTLAPEYNICQMAGNVLGTKRRPEHIEKLRKAGKKRWADPQTCAEQSERTRSHFAQNPEARQETAHKMRALWQDPEYRARQRSSHQRDSGRPERRAQLSQQVRKQLEDPEHIKRMSERAKLQFNDPEFRAKLKASQDAYWAKPENHKRGTPPLEIRIKISATLKARNAGLHKLHPHQMKLFEDAG